MEKGINKILYRVLTLVLCLCIVSGAVAPAYAASTNADSAAQKLFDLYWTTSSNPSGQNGTWYGVVRILLKDIYDRLESVWSDQRNLWTYNSTSYSLWNFSNNSNLSQSFYISNGAGPVSWLLNSMANLSQNTGYVANQFYNSNSNLNKAMSAMVSLNQNFQDYTTVLNNIKSNTDNLSGIKTDTTNLSGIKTDTANLSGIKTDTNNLNLFAAKGINVPTSIFTLSNNVGSGSNIGTPAFIYRYSRGTNKYPYYHYDGYNINNILDYLPVINNNIVSAFAGIFTENISYTYRGYSESNLSYIDYNIVSLMDLFREFFNGQNRMLAKLTYVNADDNTIAAKQANQSNEDTVLTNFTGSGSASASPSDFGAVKDSIVDFKAGFSGGASSSDTFSFMSGDSNAWDWFTQETANDLDRTQRSNTRLLRGSSDVAYDTPLLDSYYNYILPILGGED